MSQLAVRLVTERDTDNKTLTVVYGGQTYTANQDHPAWDELVAGAVKDDPKVIDLFDMLTAVGKRLSLSDRISYASGRLFFDGDEVRDELAEHIIRVVKGGFDPTPLVKLMENIAQNPSEHSRDQLYRFLRKNRFTITQDGIIVGYKGVRRGDADDDDGNGTSAAYYSVNSGPAIVNGEPHTGGPVPQNIGDVVELPRSDVEDNPAVACSRGLHVATYTFAASFASSGATLAVLVHPRDVVSVPNDASDQKVRVSKYRIVKEVDDEYENAVVHLDSDRLEITEAEHDEPDPDESPATPGAPSEEVFEAVRALAKRRKIGTRKAAAKFGLNYNGGDAQDRLSYTTQPTELDEDDYDEEDEEY